jgi:beta-phosphoglucomutase-like phosphatase (HAD superfamily)
MNFEKEVGLIWDIDGVVVDSPHEQAWRITAQKPDWGVSDLSSEFYFTYVAGRPRYEGANIILEKKSVYERLGLNTTRLKRKALDEFCKQKNKLIRELIKEKRFSVFTSSIIFLLEAKTKGLRHAAASASKNAKDLLMLTDLIQFREEFGPQYDFIKEDDTLYSVFDVDTCGLDLQGGKMEIFQVAAQKLKEKSDNEINHFIVFEDAPAGIEAAKAAGMFGVGIVRIGTAKELWDAGAYIVVNDLNELPYLSLKQQFLESNVIGRRG